MLFNLEDLFKKKKKVCLRASFLLQPSSQLLNLTPKRCPDMITVLNPVGLGIQPATSQSQCKPAETTLRKENTKCCFSFIGYFTLRFVMKKKLTVSSHYCYCTFLQPCAAHASITPNMTPRSCLLRPVGRIQFQLAVFQHPHHGVTQTR